MVKAVLFEAQGGGDRFPDRFPAGPRALSLLEVWGPRLGIDSRSLGFEHHSLDHFTNMAKTVGAISFFTPLNPFFHSETD